MLLPVCMPIWELTLTSMHNAGEGMHTEQHVLEKQTRAGAIGAVLHCSTITTVDIPTLCKELVSGLQQGMPLVTKNVPCSIPCYTFDADTAKSVV